MKKRLLLSVVVALLLTAIETIVSETDHEGHFTNSWVVEIRGGEELAHSIAKQHGFANKGQVGSLEGHYHFIDEEMDSTRTTRSMDSKHIDLMNNEHVIFAEQQVARKRVKRSLITPHDSWWPKQWYLHRTNNDMNVQQVWDQGITGKGVVVTILDDGIEHDHPDLKDNYDPQASYDYNNHDPDPMPRYDPTNENKHGTRCAGEVSAVLNNICAVGVAYRSSIGGVRMLDGKITDGVESSSLSLNPQHIDIYSSSWGPTDNGRTVDGPAKLTKKAFWQGVTEGRDGKGSIYVWAAGNGGSQQDNCNCDGYAVSPFTISIGSVTESGYFPWYAEQCSSNMAATFSSGSSGQKRIVSTDLHHGCTDRHTGTSAAAPMAAGIIALALETRPGLTWRDVQYIIAYSSNPSLTHDGDWMTNGAGLKVSLKYGFGVMDATALVNRARHWINVPTQINCTIVVNLEKKHKSASKTHQIPIDVSEELCPIGYLEHVQAITSLSINRGSRGNIQISLRSPSSTLSTLLRNRRLDYARDGFNQWPFMTVMSWGETPHGKWVYTVSANNGNEASMKDLTLILYGVQAKPQSVRDIPEQCSPQCKSGCSKLGPQYCDTCKNIQVLSTLECVDSCPPKTFLKDQFCLDCPLNCTKCTSSAKCDECEPGSYKLPSGLCNSLCSESTVLINNSCHSCHLSCKVCNGLTLHDCVECHEGPYQLLNGQCILNTTCPSGQYFEHRILACKSCHETCIECTGKGDDECTVCYSTQELEEGHCVDKIISCPEGEYFSNDTMSCALCPPGCSSCIDGLTCTQCHSNYYLFTSLMEHSEMFRTFCIQLCPSGYYGSNETGHCTACSSNCVTCSNVSDYCTSCIDAGMVPYNGVCPQPCESYQYFNYSTQQCEECPTNCSTCINSTVCIACIEGSYFNDATAQCLSQCGNNTVQNSISGHCEATHCHQTCLTCFGPDSDQCLECPKQHILFQNTCRESCPKGWSLSGSTCIECHSTCETCTGITDGDCLTCSNGKVLDNYHCLKSCRRGSYLDKENVCQSCSRYCAECTDSKCISCQSGYLMTPSKQCYKWCPRNYYNVSGICIHNDTVNTASPTTSTVEISTKVTYYSVTNQSWTVFVVLLTCLIFFGAISMVLLLFWKRQNVMLMLRRNKKQYVMLYTHPDEIEMNNIGGSDSETEIYTRSKPL